MSFELSEQQLDAFKKQLKDQYLQLREEIRQNLLRSDSENYKELAGSVHDVSDEALADLLVDINNADIDRQIQEIRDIDAALLRIANKTYGTCITCEAPISLPRLQAYPTAKRCLRCQEVYERTHAGNKTPSI